MRGTEYAFRIKAENRYGASAEIESEIIKADYQFETPKAPRKLEASDVGKDFIELEWQKPSFDGGTQINFGINYYKYYQY